jgi:hypothetical protein
MNTTIWLKQNENEIAGIRENVCTIRINTMPTLFGKRMKTHAFILVCEQKIRINVTTTFTVS